MQNRFAGHYYLFPQFLPLSSFFLKNQNVIMDQLIIRKATLKDLSTLLRLEQGVINAERPFDGTLRDDLIHYYDIEEMIAASSVEIVVAELDKEIIGSGYARIENAKPYLKHQNHAYLGFMYVKPEYRRRGVNEKILEALKQWSIAKKLTEMRLDVYVENLQAQKAYEKAGFTPYMQVMRLGI